MKSALMRSALERSALVVISVLVLAGSLPVPAAAQSLPIEAQTREARRVVLARVVSEQARYETNQFGDMLIVSDLQLEVEETLKGVPSPLIETTIEGGTIGATTLRVSDIPAMRTGDRAVFFLDEQPGGRHVPHKRGLGILKVDPAGRVNAEVTLADVRRAIRAALQ
jgi:hypothetical protein